MTIGEKETISAHNSGGDVTIHLRSYPGEKIHTSVCLHVHYRLLYRMFILLGLKK